MHPLLPLYATFSALMMFGLETRDAKSRFMQMIAAWGSMSVILIAVFVRPLEGDTGRYYTSFLVWRTLRISQIWDAVDTNWLFVLSNWVLGQFGTSPLLFTIPFAVFCIFMLRHSLRQLLGKNSSTTAIFLYSVYPYFIMYIASGVKQAIAMALLMQAYIELFQSRRRGWMWLLLAPLFHSGALLVFLPFSLHYFMYSDWLGRKKSLAISLIILAICTLLSITNLNETLMEPVKSLASFSSRYDIYFADASNENYQAGFRWDFTAFSFLPILAAIWLRGRGRGLSLRISGWWLNLYILLNCVYQLFAYAPYADRFAGFGWHVIPLILVVMIVESGEIRFRQLVILSFSFINIAILQFYTGNFLKYNL